jgi:hypothetical protein
MDMKVTVKKTGPVFDGRAVAAADQFVAEWGKQLSQETFNLVQADMSLHFRNPTGFYQSNVVTDRVGKDRWRVHDNMVVYGPWLEGVGSRNATSRFKGYAHWRRTVQRVNQIATTMGNQIVGQFLNRMRG